MDLSLDVNELNFRSRKVEKGKKVPEVEKDKKEIFTNLFQSISTSVPFFFPWKNTGNTFKSDLITRKKFPETVPKCVPLRFE